MYIVSEKKRGGPSDIGKRRKQEVRATIASTQGSRGDSGGGRDEELPFIRQVRQNKSRDDARLSDLFMGDKQVTMVLLI